MLCSFFRLYGHGRRGMSLTEGIIGLSIAGVVLGGIWSAASITQRKAHTNETVTSLVQTIQNIRSLYSQQSRFTLSANEDIGARLREANVIPQKLLGNGGAIQTSWGHPIIITTGQAANSTEFRIRINGLDTEVCKAIATSFAAQAQAVGLNSLLVNSISYTNSSSPSLRELNPAVLPATCVNLALTLNLKR